jgi:hypothetical protein
MYQQNQSAKEKALEERVKNLEDDNADKKRTAAAQWFAIALSLITGVVSVIVALLLKGLGAA